MSKVFFLFLSASENGEPNRTQFSERVVVSRDGYGTHLPEDGDLGLGVHDGLVLVVGVVEHDPRDPDPGLLLLGQRVHRFGQLKS